MSQAASSELNPVKRAVLRVLEPITSARPSSGYPTHRTAAGRDLPAYYLVYFLLVKLVGIRNLGRHDKVAWTIPIEYKGKFFAIEHRKMGLGIFAQHASADEAEAAEIAERIRRAVKVAAPFFEQLAAEAVQKSELNVRNQCVPLFKRYSYLRDLFRQNDSAAEKRRDERQVTKRKTPHGVHTSIDFPYVGLKQEARWLGQSAIEAFFSWTEHVFIHLALLQGNIRTAAEVADLAGKDWSEKFKRALDMSDPATKQLYDELCEIRRQIRNFLAHGAFGKQGQAFEFHSDVGTVPVLLPHQVGKQKFTVQGRLSFHEDEALATAEKFIQHLWSGSREPARIYLQEEEFPTVLTYVADGTYTSAMSSIEGMEEFAKVMNYNADQAMNMDW